jgi:molybdenum ABC transporter molybdate-binding protein
MAAQTFGTVLLWLIILAIAVVIAVYILRWLYRRSTKEVAFVRTGFLGEKVVVNGGAFVIPVLHEITPVNMNVMRIEVRRENGSALITKNRMRVDLIAEFFVRVGASRQLVAAAAQTLGDRAFTLRQAFAIVEGAPVDLFLSASREWATKVEDEGLAENSKELLTNKLVLVVPKGNPAGVIEPKDLASDGVKKISLAGENVPAGKYADQALTKLGLLDKLMAAGKIARAQDVRGALNFVANGEAEAGIVYSTDLAAASDVEMVHEFDPTLHDEIVYVVVLLKHGAENPAAKKFFDYLQSDDANGVYEKTGFERVNAR